MLIFPEEQTLYSRDNTLDPAYFAKKPLPLISPGTMDRELIKEIIKEIIDDEGGAATAEEVEQLNEKVETITNIIVNLQTYNENNTTTINALQQTIILQAEKITALENKVVHKELTRAQYEALSNEEKMADIEYFVS